jgi:predicted nucleic acid-binding protein
MMVFQGVYFDSSVILRRTFRQAGALTEVKFETAISSELVLVEIRRTIANRHLLEPWTAEALAKVQQKAGQILGTLEILPVDRVILNRAMATFPTRIGSLDAIHLATALVWGEYVDPDLVFLTHDRQLAIAARACGLRVYPEAV